MIQKFITKEEENNHQVQLISNIPNYKSVGLQGKYFYVSAQSELCEHFYWNVGPELNDKPEKLNYD